MPVELHTLLREARLARGLSQRLAHLLDVPDVYPSKWERGALLPTWRSLALACAVLDIDPGEAFLARVGAMDAREPAGLASRTRLAGQGFAR